MTHALALPPSLRSSVARVHGARDAWEPRELGVAFLPTCASTIVVNVTAQGELKVFAAGPWTSARYKIFVPGPFFVQLVLRPDAARDVLGVPVRELVDRVVELDQLWGRRAHDVAERAAPHLDDPQATAFAIGELLANRVGASATHLVRGATQALDAGASIGRLARDLVTSERSLRQAFRDHVGVSPKRYARIARIRRVAAAAGSEPWTRLAADHGFYDQAHLNAEFRALLRVSPSEYLAKQFPFVRG
jgi:AraC-like DNA-binding protein